MSKKNFIKPVAAVIGAALLGSLSVVNLAAADENPFAAVQPESRSMILAGNEEGGTSKCSGDKTEAASEGTSGAEEAASEGTSGEQGAASNCGGDTKKSATKCSGDMKEGEANCGSGK